MLTPAVLIRDSAKTFPLEIGRIFCLTTNYRDHAKEMGGTGQERPSVFLKPWTALLPLREGEEGEVPFPGYGAEMHHEVELVMACINGADWAFGVGLDLTMRDVQKSLKAKGLPWLLSKGFDRSAPVSTLLHPSLVANPDALEIALDVNGTVRQKGHPGEMTIGVADVPSFIAEFSAPRAGDLVFTGTPQGVGPLKAGDRCAAGLSIGGNLAASLKVRII
jgi:fumarylpyruvate hydrolase